MQVNMFFLYILTNKQAFVRIYSDVTCPAVSPSDLPVHDCKSSFNYTCGEMRGTVSCHDGRCAALDGVYDCGGGRAEAPRDSGPPARYPPRLPAPCTRSSSRSPASASRCAPSG